MARMKSIDCPEPPSATAVSTSTIPSTRWKLISVACTGSSELVSRKIALGAVSAVRSIHQKGKRVTNKSNAMKIQANILPQGNGRRGLCTV